MSGLPVLPGIAMTGEITLRGKVLKVGGIRAKIMAAKKAGIKKVFIPEANRDEYGELPLEIRDGIEAIMIKSCETVIMESLENLKKIKRSQAITKENVLQ
jgi:ATP-dependent Lon protease